MLAANIVLHLAIRFSPAETKSWWLVYCWSLRSCSLCLVPQLILLELQTLALQDLADSPGGALLTPQLNIIKSELSTTCASTFTSRPYMPIVVVWLVSLGARQTAGKDEAARPFQ